MVAYYEFLEEICVFLGLDVLSFPYGRRAAIYLKNYWTFYPVLALTYLKITSLSLARFWPYC